MFFKTNNPAVDRQNADDKLHYSTDQETWSKLSSEVIEEFSKKIPGFLKTGTIYDHNDQPIKDCPFLAAYQFLAEERYEIAKKLKHEPLGRFGIFCDELYIAWEEINIASKDNPWKEQTPAIVKALETLIMTNPQPDKKNPFYSFRKTDKQTDLPYTCYEWTFNLPTFLAQQQTYGKYSKTLSTISYLIDPNDRKNDKIIITYPGWNKHTLCGDYQIANFLFKQLIDFKKEEGIAKFLFHAGLLSYYLAHRLLVKRGNGAIVEWMILGLAKYHGLDDLKTFCQKESLGWYMKALVTPRIDDYAKEYHRYAFGDIKIDHPYSDDIDYYGEKGTISTLKK